MTKGKEAAERSVTLDQLEKGRHGRVVRVRGGGALRRRIMDMGVVAGAGFEVQTPAPLGDPMRIKLKGFMLSLRRTEAAHVEVRPE